MAKAKQAPHDVRQEAVAAVEAVLHDGRTQEEVAVRLGVSLSAVSRWHRGERRPTRTQAKRVMRVLALPWDDLRA